MIAASSIPTITPSDMDVVFASREIHMGWWHEIDDIRDNN
jgi:hypothetical protein